MKRAAAFLALLLIAFTLPAAAAIPPCSLCVGTVPQEIATTATPVPQILRVTLDEFDRSPAETLPAGQAGKAVIVVSFTVGGDDPLAEADQRVRAIVQWAEKHGPFDTLALDIEHGDPAVTAYAVKRTAVAAQGLSVAGRLALAPMPLERLQQLFEHGAQAYFDVLLANGGDVAAAAAWLAEHDPAKKIFAIVTPASPNPLYDAARALADGATMAFLEGDVDPAAVAHVNRALGGDFAFDSTSRPAFLDARGEAADIRALQFVRGEDLRSIVVPAGAAEPLIVSLPADQYAEPHRVDAGGEKAIADTGTRSGRLLFAVQPSPRPYLLYVNRAQKPDANITREAIDVATQRGITVEEIIRNHQAWEAFQDSIQVKYIARNTTKLRFAVGRGGDSVEATIAGDYFSDPAGRADWVWQDFLINGVRWRYGRIPELPLIQPEKVTQLPLDIHLSNDYRYQLVRETDVAGYRVYEVRFEPPANAPEGLPLYRGTVFIDKRSWARIRISMVQLNLTGEVLSNEERVDFQPFDRLSHAALNAEDVAVAEARSVLWLPADISAQQVISAAGRANVILRHTNFTNFRIEPAGYEEIHQQVSASDARMVRETEAGLRYLEKRGEGERVVKDGYNTSQLFMVGGVHHDAGLEFPVIPLGGIDYFDFDLFDRGIQANVFFAGVMLAANATHPNVASTRTNVGVDFFGIAIPFQNTMYRNGEERPGEAVKVLPLVLTARAGHPIFNFGKVDLSFTAAHLSYQRAEDTDAGYTVPSDTFLFGPTVSAHYARWGYSLALSWDQTTRSSWEPWGDLSEYDEKQKSFTRFGASLGKSFYLPRFQRIGIDLNYLDGSRLDRFSKYELGFFGAQRVHGVRSGSVRAERAIIGHLSYGFVFSEQFRIEAFYDHAVLDDESAGFRREPFQGIGIAGQTVGPYGTLVRLDIGKMVGRNAQDGFVANVVFLKLF
ncbi:MAG TPA: hypothetical protein VM779_06855 [Thermoanaerobaculia bacterium]|nr:hypothetical protein [Thermoanaerobaculia bacterium]